MRDTIEAMLKSERVQLDDVGPRDAEIESVSEERRSGGSLRASRGHGAATSADSEIRPARESQEQR